MKKTGSCSQSSALAVSSTGREGRRDLRREAAWRGGATIELADVLIFADGERTSAGAEELSGVSVTATVLEQKRDDTSSQKRRHKYRRKNAIGST